MVESRHGSGYEAECLRSRMLGVPAQDLVRREVTALPEDLEIGMRVSAECEPEHGSPRRASSTVWLGRASNTRL